LLYRFVQLWTRPWDDFCYLDHIKNSADDDDDDDDAPLPMVNANKSFSVVTQNAKYLETS